MKLLNLGLAEPIRTQAIYHMLAREGIETLIITSPIRPYVCIGYFQDLMRTVNLNYCHEMNIPVYRREVGGGGVLLDQNQLFYQIVLKKDNPFLPKTIERIYEKFSKPPIEAYSKLGVTVNHRPVNDLITLNGKKISGQGGANIGNCVVFVGSIIMDFDFYTMANVLNIPNEKFRDKLYKTIRENMTTLKQELKILPDRKVVEDILINEFKEFFRVTAFKELLLNDDLIHKLQNVETLLASENFINGQRKLFMKDAISIKVAEGLFVGETNFKLPGGLVTAIVEWKENIIKTVSIFGDFTLTPKESIKGLEESLSGVELKFDDVYQSLSKFYEENKIDIPGCPPAEMARGILKVIETS